MVVSSLPDFFAGAQRTPVSLGLSIAGQYLGSPAGLAHGTLRNASSRGLAAPLR